MRLETSAYSCMGEIALHSEEFSLGAIFGIVQLDPSSLHVGQLVLVCSVPVYVSDDPWVFEVNEGVVNEELTGRQRMEDVKVSVLNPSMVEVGRRESPSMEGGGILTFSFVMYSYKVGVFPNAPIGNVLSCFCLSLFIEKDNGIKVGLSTIIPYPPFTRVVRVLEVTGKGGGKANRLGRGCGPGNSGLILRKMNGFITVNTVLAHIWFGEI